MSHMHLAALRQPGNASLHARILRFRGLITDSGIMGSKLEMSNSFTSNSAGCVGLDTDDEALPLRLIVIQRPS